MNLCKWPFLKMANLVKRGKGDYDIPANINKPFVLISECTIYKLLIYQTDWKF